MERTPIDVMVTEVVAANPVRLGENDVPIDKTPFIDAFLDAGFEFLGSRSRKAVFIDPENPTRVLAVFFKPREETRFLAEYCAIKMMRALFPDFVPDIYDDAITVEREGEVYVIGFYRERVWGDDNIELQDKITDLLLEAINLTRKSFVMTEDLQIYAEAVLMKNVSELFGMSVMFDGYGRQFMQTPDGRILYVDEFTMFLDYNFPPKGTGIDMIKVQTWIDRDLNDTLEGKKKRKEEFQSALELLQSLRLQGVDGW